MTGDYWLAGGIAFYVLAFVLMLAVS